MPAPRITDQALWDEVKERQKGLRRVRDFHTKRRPRMLLSFLLRCGTCGGGFSKVSEKHYGCSTARNKGTCDNSPGSLRGGKSCRRCSRVQPKPILLHPNMAAHYCKQVADLEQALTAEENRAEATDLLRSLLDRMELTPNDQGRLELDLYGDLAAI